jgi:hypothetical protein
VSVFALFLFLRFCSFPDKLYNVSHIKSQILDLQAAASLAKKESKKFDLGHFMFCGSPGMQCFALFPNLFINLSNRILFRVFRFSVSLHAIDLVGTGKTTVARVIAHILYELELISVRDRLVETSGTQLVGDYVGQTKTKVWEKMKEANGGVLFIDEAYMLANQRASYADEAVASLIEGMTSNELKGLVIIIAGYRDQIEAMLDSCNPGLKSRFTHLVEFKDWTADNCCEFFTNTAKVYHAIHIVCCCSPSSSFSPPSPSCFQFGFLTNCLERVLHD